MWADHPLQAIIYLIADPEEPVDPKYVQDPVLELSALHDDDVRQHTPWMTFSLFSNSRMAPWIMTLTSDHPM